MARRRVPRYEVLPSSSLSALDACRICLACIGGVSAPFSGVVFDCALPCTGTKHLPCQIINHLSAWNEALIQGLWELRERPRTRPQLALASIDPCVALDDLETLLKVATLLCSLIRRHHCVTAVDVVIGRLKEYDALLCDALRGNEHIHSLTLVDFTHNRDAYKKFFSVVPSLKNLKHFKYTTDADLEWAHMEALESTLEKTNRLESLNIPGLWNYDMNSTGLLTAITAHTSLVELSMDFSFFEQASDDCCDAFSEYLKNSGTVATLSLDGDCDFRNTCGKVILPGMRDSKSIIKVKLDEVFVDNESLELIASIFERNTVLRSFHIHPSCKCFIEHGGYCDRWLPSLTQNDTIEEMTLPFQIWQPKQWLQLFGVLSTKKSLKGITVGWRDVSESDLKEFCKAVCESGVEEKVAFAADFDLSLYGNNFSLLRCKSFVDIAAHCGAGIPELEKLVVEIAALNYVTSLRLSIFLHPSDDFPLSPVADLIGSTTTLKALNLFLSTDASANYTNVDWTATIQSLSCNQSITKLRICSDIMETEEMERLADVIRGSQIIRRLCVRVGEDWLSLIFWKHLSRGIAGNYSLVSAEFLERSDQNAFAIRDTVRRNCGLVARASQFQMGAQLERVTAGALERVFRHRALLEEFADVECISVEKAAATLRAALRPFDDMHSFMRMAGVVRSSVVCHARRDGRTQLDALNEPCWRALRRYLFLDYVVTQASPACGLP